MGGGIAMNFANIGIPVTIVERDSEALERGLAVVGQIMKEPLHAAESPAMTSKPEWV